MHILDIEGDREGTIPGVDEVEVGEVEVIGKELLHEPLALLFCTIVRNAKEIGLTQFITSVHSLLL